jgi:hypothetical protein
MGMVTTTLPDRGGLKEHYYVPQARLKIPIYSLNIGGLKEVTSSIFFVESRIIK